MATSLDSFYHAEFKAWRSRWRRVRDCVGGGDDIRRACFIRGRRGQDGDMHLRGVPGSQLYVPWLLDELFSRYKARVSRGLWYDATARTLDAWLGALFRKDSHPQLPEWVEPHQDNIDLAATPYDSFKQHLARELFITGRVGVWQDYSEELKRPYWILYPAENILCWSQRRMPSGALVNDLVVLFETVSKRVDEGFSVSTKVQLRVLELDPDSGNYTVRIFEETQAGIEESTELMAVPTIGKKPMTEIPFVCFGPRALGWHMARAPLLAVADVNLDHFRLDVDLKNALHVNALGTLFIYGGDPEKQFFELGPDVTHVLPAGAKAEIVSGATAVEPVVAEKTADEDRMAMLGARMLMRPKKAAETAESMVIQTSGETASLATIADVLSQGLMQLWKWHVSWKGGAVDLTQIGDTLSKDFTSLRLSSQDVEEMMRVVQAGKLSTQTFLENLSEGEWIRHDADEEQQRLDAEQKKEDERLKRLPATDPYADPSLMVPPPDGGPPQPLPTRPPRVPPIRMRQAPAPKRRARVKGYLSQQGGA